MSGVSWNSSSVNNIDILLVGTLPIILQRILLVVIILCLLFNTDVVYAASQDCQTVGMGGIFRRQGTMMTFKSWATYLQK